MKSKAERWADELEQFGFALDSEKDVATELRRLAAVEEELEGRYQSIIEMGNMLTEIVNLIRGEPKEGTSHSTHDAVDLVRGLAMHYEDARAELERIKTLPPVAWRLLDKDPAGGSDDRWVVYTQDDFKPGVNPTEHFNVEPLITLGSKTDE